MEIRLRFATIGPNLRPRLLPRSRRWHRSVPAFDPLARHKRWADRITGRSAFGLAAMGWGRLGRTLAMLRQTILGAGGAAWPVGGPSVRAEASHASRREGEPRGARIPAGPTSPLVERLLERVRLVEADATYGRASLVTHRRPVVIHAVTNDGERVVRPARTVAAVRMAAGGGPAPSRTVSAHVPASVPRVLAVARPPTAPPQATSSAPPPQRDALRSELNREPLTSSAPAASWLAGPSIAAIPPAVVEQLTDRVVRAIDRRVISARERFGLGPG